ncbi:hypothetical protein WA026_019840 [Henosepilachna vigintioctopunctata]|uniref:Peptidase S1 domain-containing protein n=1 Tax=Henosepilachna vigintioctopunctata TaxID=420089 RepID=A0AAW1VB17_9CUCU
MKRSFYFITICQLILIEKLLAQNFSSPCPRLFSYEMKSIEKDRYFGNVRVETLEELNGVWLRLIFDRACVQLGNWLGEVTTEDNKEFLIKKSKLNLKSGDFLTVRFYVKFTVGRQIPQLTSIRLNGRIVCPEKDIEPVQTTTISFPPVTTTFNILLEDRHANVTTESISTISNIPPSPYNLIQEIEFPAPTPSYQKEVETEDYGEFFQGDLSLVSFRPRYEECGTVMTPPNGLEHGNMEYEGAFPWHSAIYLSKGTELTYICAASLISSRFLITAAHCVTKRNSEIPVRPEHLLVYLGKYFLRRWSNAALQERQIQDIFVHEYYDHMSTKNNIALLKLVKPVKSTQYVRPVCLWKGDSNLQNIIGESGVVIGWGFNEHGIITNKLIKTYMPVVPRETCIRSYPEFFTHFTSNNSFCARFSNDTSICTGDSGGGMIFPQKHPGIHKPLHYLRGIVSISVALQNEFKCDSEHYIVFTDVAKYLPWIEKFKIN